MNKILMSGRLTKDPQITYTQGETPMAIARFTLAVDRIKKGEADFPSCIAFGKTAELIEQYVKKGTKILIEAHLQTGSYTNKDNIKVYTTDVVVDKLEFCERAREEQPQPMPMDMNGFQNIPDGIDDINLPFQ